MNAETATTTSTSTTSTTSNTTTTNNNTNSSNNVTHLAGDFNEVAHYLTKNNYDAIVSWLTVLHLPNRIRSFTVRFSVVVVARVVEDDVCVLM